MSKSFIFVTGNANKLREVKAILATGDSGIECTSQSVELPEIQGTTQEVALAKVKAAAAALGAACVTEDTALGFEALGGLPGPYIKDFLETVGHDGLNKMLSGFANPRATALCTFAYCAGPGAEPILFEGRTEGTIVPARGPNAFGWDPVFEPTESNGLTYAEMASEDKNRISHRYRALQKLKTYLASQ